MKYYNICILLLVLFFSVTLVKKVDESKINTAKISTPVSSPTIVDPIIDYKTQEKEENYLLDYDLKSL